MELRSRLSEVSAEARAVVDEADLPITFAESIAERLSLDGRILAAEPLGRWSRLVLAASEAAGLADWHQAVPAAAAVELVVASFEIFDDIQDGDSNPLVDRLGPPQALNVALALLLLGQRAFLRLPRRGVAAEVALAVQGELSDAIARVGGGQYLDLAAQNTEQDKDPSEREVVDIAGRKTADLVAGACRVGGRLATADRQVLEALGRFGWHIGLADQIQNDLDEGSVEGRVEGRWNQPFGRATLPAAVARTFALGDEMTDILGSGRRESLARLGALHYTWVMMDLHRQQARDVLEELGPTHATEALRDIL